MKWDGGRVGSCRASIAGPVYLSAWNRVTSAGSGKKTGQKSRRRKQWSGQKRAKDSPGGLE